MKKIYNAPQVKVIEIKNDILTNSPGGIGGGEKMGYGEYAPGRNGMWEDDFSEEDLY